jgi:hypothetical protein
MRRARRDAGFSLAALIFFLTAVSVTITFTAVPSYVMEAKREREKELIFRGEEYTRAIQKYQRTLNLLPNSADDLLASNGTRFLRKAYADPVSGEPWRMIILNSNGTLTGSNIYQTMSQVPTTTSQLNTAPPQQSNSQSNNRPNGSLQTNTIQSSLNGNGQQGGLNGTGQQQNGLNGTGQQQNGLNGTGQQQSGLNGATNNQRPNTTGQVSPTNPTPAQPQNQQAVPLQGWVGVGSASKGPGVLVYNKQEDYSNWEFLAVLQQRGTGGNTGAPGAGGGGTGGTNRPGGTNAGGGGGTNTFGGGGANPLGGGGSNPLGGGGANPLGGGGAGGVGGAPKGR